MLAECVVDSSCLLHVKNSNVSYSSIEKASHIRYVMEFSQKNEHNAEGKKINLYSMIIGACFARTES